MEPEYYIYIIVFLLWLASAVQGVKVIAEGLKFHAYVRDMVRGAVDLMTPEGAFRHQPRVAIIMPCRGVDEKLKNTIAALENQNYDGYEITFTFESEDDPAHAAIREWTAGWERIRTRFVVAGLAENRSQKIHNLLAAVDQVSGDCEVLIFLDSDAVPHDNWIGHLVAPLQDEGVGAATGYRWYVACGGLAAGVRTAWNAATVSLLADDKHNFAWGGSTAIKRERFDSLDIRGYWAGALSDDLQLSRAVREAGLVIRFVPQALISSSDSTTMGGFLSFARRQVIITRICAFDVLRSGVVLCVSLMAGGIASAGLFVVGFFDWFGSRWSMWAGLAGWAFVTICVAAMSVLRQMGLRMVLKPPDLTWRDFLWDLGGSLTFAGSLHLNLVFSSWRRRRFFWRNIEYEMISPEETRVLKRVDP